MANFNLNKVILGGRLTRDVELNETPNGTAVCSFSIAVNRKVSKDSEQQTDFINCVAWRSTAEFISDYFHKGSSICIVGKIQTRSWEDNEGQKRYATDVIVDEVYFVDSKSESQETAPTYTPPTVAHATAFPQVIATQRVAPSQLQTAIDDDDLPF